MSFTQQIKNQVCDLDKILDGESDYARPSPEKVLEKTNSGDNGEAKYQYMTVDAYKEMQASGQRQDVLHVKFVQLPFL